MTITTDDLEKLLFECRELIKTAAPHYDLVDDQEYGRWYDRKRKVLDKLFNL